MRQATTSNAGPPSKVRTRSFPGIVWKIDGVFCTVCHRGGVVLYGQCGAFTAVGDEVDGYVPAYSSTLFYCIKPQGRCG